MRLESAADLARVVKVDTMDHLQVLIKGKFQWQTCTCTNFDGRWKQWADCREALNNILENSRKNTSARWVQFHINKRCYLVDVWEMHQTNMNTGTVRAVRRVFIDETDFLATEMVLEDQCLKQGDPEEMMTDAEDNGEVYEGQGPVGTTLRTVEAAALIVEVLD